MTHKKLISTLLLTLLLLPSMAEAEELTWDLKSLYREYVRTNAEIQEKRYLMESSNSTARASEGQLYPKLGFTTSVNATQGGPFSTFLSTIGTPGGANLNATIYQFSTGLTLSYLLFDNGRRGADVRKNLALSEVSTLEEKRVREERLYDLATSYFSLALLRVKRKYIEETRKEYDRLEKVVHLKAEQGKYLSLDEEQFKIKGEELNLALENNQQEQAFITSRLDDFLKNNQKNVYDTSPMEYWLENFIPLDVPQAKLEKSALYREQDATIKARESDLTATESQLWPTLSLTGNYLYQKGSLTFGDAFGNLASSWTGTLSLDWTLWDNAERENRRRSQEFQMLAARSSLSKVKDGVDFNMKTIKKDHGNQRNSLRVLEKAYGLSGENLKIQRVRYDTGLSREELLINALVGQKDARERVLDSRLQLEVLRARYLKEASALEETIFDPRYLSGERGAP